MLVRLLLIACLVGAALYAWRWYQAQKKARGRSLTEEERAHLRKLAARDRHVREALEVRERLLEAPLLKAHLDVRDGVEDAVRELVVKAELKERLERTAEGLEAKSAAERLEAARAAVEAADDEEARAHAEERLRVLARQRDFAAELRKRARELERAEERIVLGLCEVNIALAELSATQSEAFLGAKGDARAKLEEASAELKRHAEAHDDVSALLKAAARASE